MFWKNAGLVCIVLAAMGVVSYAQTTKPRGRSANLQGNSGYLGVGLRDVTPEVAKALNLRDSTGVLVTYVNGEPAARAGIHENDVIVEFNGQKAIRSDELTNTILSKAPGTKVSLTILRGKTMQNLTATLGSRPLGLPLTVPYSGDRVPADDMQMAMAAINAVSAPRFGFEVHEMMPQLSAFFGVHDGLLVESVDRGTAAEKAGLKAGDVITKVNGLPVSTAREVFGIIRQSGRKVISFTVFRNKKELNLSLELAWNRDPFNRDEIN